MKNIIFIRFKNSKVGGAENYLNKICTKLKDSQILSTNTYKEKQTIQIKITKFLPSFVRFLIFLYKYENYKKQNPNNIYFSLERVLNCDIYRAGDGVHKEWLEIKNDNFIKKTKSYFNPMNPIYTNIEKRLFKNAKIIIANSNMIKDSIHKYYKINTDKIKVIHNGINLPQSINKQEAKEQIIKMLNIKNTNIILFVGSGYARKGLKEALLMLDGLKSDYCFIVIGKEKKLQLYKNLAKSLKIDNKVHFLGARDDAYLFYLASDIFLFPTIYEPCSNATLEAASYKNAIITTKTNGAGEIFNKEYILDSYNDIQSGSNMLERLLQDETHLKTIQQSCFNSVQNLDMDTHINKTLEVILKI
ncbi:glycosyltransferase family 4 protein [Helicobacter sp. WB40]|uniref:glycosyltransferase family 4 protein n=1 Tax=Helicobacter sp. WB40 TaxID=3004130 RepID=UPI0022EBF077|nr:glycosyltransferase family 4 protein [Helicobacter sp. WB40]MDA3966370.1 glycosyltransferase family 4 protein [Helicobacter sp. WB40]